MSKLLSYKGYKGTCDASIEDRCLHGKVLFINGLISYEGQTVDELEENFKLAIDDYLEDCVNLAKSRTGFKDANGNPIFTGDIVQHIFPDTGAKDDPVLVYFKEGKYINCKPYRSIDHGFSSVYIIEKD
jgi:predicted RNase H-like HicB family nuclease